jgi:hypothetical protein
MSDLASLYIKVDSSGVVTASKDFDSLAGKSRTAEKATQSVTSSFQSQIAVVRQLAAAYGAYKIAQYIKDATMLAARYETLGVVMRVVGNNAGYTGAQMEKFAAGIEKTGISMTEARQSLTRMVQAQFDLNNSSKLARIAQDAAVIGNINSSEAFERMIVGIQQAQPLILRAIGLNVTFEQGYVRTAATLGKNVDQLSETEKLQSRVNEVMKVGTYIAGTYEAAMGTAGKQVLSLERHVENLKVAFGLAFTPALAEIIETITGAITDLNGELSGDSKDKIAEWGTNFRITLIDIEAEIRRLAMLLDKIGGTATSAQMLLYGTGRALGVKSSTKRFESAADSNIEYENRYKANEQALIDLAAKRLKLEQSLTAEGKKAAQAAVDAAEAKVLSARKTEIAVAAETAEAKKLREEYKKTKQGLEEDIRLAGLEGIRKEFEQNSIAYENAIKESKKYSATKQKEIEALAREKKALADKGIIDKVVTAAMEKETEAYQKAFEIHKEYLMATRGEGSPEYLEAVKSAIEAEALKRQAIAESAGFEFNKAEWVTNKLMEEDAKRLEAKAIYYSGIKGMENEAYQATIAAARIREKINVKLYGDEQAAATEANQKIIGGLNNKIDAEQEWFNTVISNFSSIVDAARDCYAEDSDEYKRLGEIKKAVLVAEQMMVIAKNIAVLQGITAQTAATVAGATAQNAANSSVAVTGAVASVASQGTGDPYTAFARIAAMIAIMASVLSIIGISFSGGSSSGGAASSAHLQKSTVLGAADGTGSESLSNSLEILKDTYDIENTRLTQIYNEMRDLNNNIIGLVTSIVSTGGISTEGMGLDLSTISSKASVNTGDFVTFTDALDYLKNETNGVASVLLSGYLELTSWAGNAINGLVGDILGGETTKKLKEAGIAFGETLVSNLLSGADAQARQYAKVKITEEGGWFGSDSTKTKWYYDSLDASVTRMITLVYNNISSGLIYMAQELGGDVADVYAYVFEAEKLNLKNMSTDEMNTALSEYFSKIADVAVESLFGDLISQYQELNEGLYETAVRLISDKATIEKILELTNQTFSGTTSEFIKFSESLITVAGSLDDLTDAFSTYYDAFFTDAEKQADYKKSLQGVLGSYGYSLPTEREDYRDIVETPGISQEAYYALMAVADTADKYYDYLENIKSSISPENYSTNVEYQRALAGFADGGISVGPESGYEAKLHGTELIVSPKKGYSATVKGLSNDDVVAAIDSLKATIGQGNFYSKANSDKMTRILERWEGAGLPDTRVN